MGNNLFVGNRINLHALCDAVVVQCVSSDQFFKGIRNPSGCILNHINLPALCDALHHYCTTAGNWQHLQFFRAETFCRHIINACQLKLPAGRHIAQMFLDFTS